MEISLTGRAGEVMSIRLSSQAVDEQHGGSASSGFAPYGLDNHTSLYLEYRCRASQCPLLLCEPAAHHHSAVAGTVGSCIRLVSHAATWLHAQASPGGGLRQRGGLLVLSTLFAGQPPSASAACALPVCRQRDFISQTDLLQPSSRAAYAWDEPEQAHMLQLGLDGRILADCPLDQASRPSSCISFMVLGVAVAVIGSWTGQPVQVKVACFSRLLSLCVWFC